jgi:hypothetical protein
MTAAIVALVLAMLATGGVVYASDGAAPGDTLYGVDLAVEQARLGLTANPGRAVQLQLGFADERLEEAEELIDEGDMEHLGEALGGYGHIISSVVHTIHSAEGMDEEELTDLLEGELARHGARLGHTVEQMEQTQEGDEPGADFCVGADPHPVAQALDELYESASYEDIMGWFCDDNFGFGEIALALQTSEETGMLAGDILVMRSESGWGQVWRELDLTRGNRPDHAGQPEEPGQQGNQGQGQDSQGQGQGNQGQGQGQGSQGQGQGQGQGNQGQGQGNQGQGQGQGGSAITEECLASLTEEDQTALAALAEAYDREYEDSLELLCEGLTFEEIEARLMEGPPGRGQGQGRGGPEECTVEATDEDVAALTALAESYDVEYEDVLELFCEGLTFEEIEARLIEGPPGQGQGQGNQGQGQGQGQGNQP